MVVVIAVIHTLDDARRTVQGAEAGSHEVVARLGPRSVASRLGADRCRWDTSLRGRRALDDWLEQARRSPGAHELVDVAQMEAELVVPDRVHARVMLAAEPPEPVAAFCDQDLAPRQGGLLRFLRTLLGLRVEPIASLRQQIPRDVVLGIADPGVEARADPAAGVQAVELLLRRVLF